ncbi:FG-GAP repeat domain-containing protein [Pseudobacteriovorax antillogorgiicola]|uniref:Repeat domain-containing protein n=1 Tax=Pseudobacteriovorax antillogorgiicola TaxID=1513793 RepID=A0A1Y6BJ54_9BACT|nr:VCBS repeat-containing protein [Pseudobacteriovorax antillogorgiicola]TCS55594.1 hypothetical protein EDD56_105320 [Pseudobacteriovorax antillogorgiicola]SMF10476.1 hypothetical protein SAMN06296036_1054 [Pseudobacteriovorax antillogorgiicola]
MLSCSDELSHGESTSREGFTSQLVSQGDTCERVVQNGVCENGTILWDQGSFSEECNVYNPKISFISSTENEFEISAEAQILTGENQFGETFPLSKNENGYFVGEPYMFPIPEGFMVRLTAQNSTGQVASTDFFPYLIEEPALKIACRGGEVPHESTITRTAFESELVPYGSECVEVTEVGTCESGNIEWSSSKPSSCKAGYLSCGDTPHGDEVELYGFESKVVAHKDICTRKVTIGYCNNGTIEVDPSSDYISSCENLPPKSCGHIGHGRKVVELKYKDSSASSAEICESDTEVRYCYDGEFEVEKESQFSFDSCDSTPQNIYMTSPTLFPTTPPQPNPFYLYGTNDHIVYGFGANCSSTELHGELSYTRVYTTGITETIGTQCQQTDISTRCINQTRTSYEPSGQFYASCEKRYQCEANSIVNRDSVDLDGDGSNEFLFTCASDTKFQIAIAKSLTSNPVFFDSIEVGAKWNLWNQSISDVDSDGRMDLVLEKSGIMNVFYQQDGMRFSNSVDFINPPIAFVEEPPYCRDIVEPGKRCCRFSGIDFDVDGQADVSISILSDKLNSTYIYRREGLGYSVRLWSEQSGDWRSFHPVIADSDGDGDKDIVFVNRSVRVAAKQEGGVLYGKLKLVLKKNYYKLWDQSLKIRDSNGYQELTEAQLSEVFSEYAKLAEYLGHDYFDAFASINKMYQEYGLGSIAKNLYYMTARSFEDGNRGAMTASLSILNRVDSNIGTSLAIEFGISPSEFATWSLDNWMFKQGPTDPFSSGGTTPCGGVCQSASDNTWEEFKGDFNKSKDTWKPLVDEAKKQATDAIEKDFYLGDAAKKFKNAVPFLDILESAFESEGMNTEAEPRDFYNSEVDRAWDKLDKIDRAIHDGKPHPTGGSWFDDRDEARQELEEAENERDKREENDKARRDAAYEKAKEEARKSEAEKEAKRKEEEERRKAEEKEDADSSDGCDQNPQPEHCGGSVPDQSDNVSFDLHCGSGPGGATDPIARFTYGDPYGGSGGEGCTSEEMWDIMQQHDSTMQYYFGGNGKYFESVITECPGGEVGLCVDPALASETYSGRPIITVKPDDLCDPYSYTPSDSCYHDGQLSDVVTEYDFCNDPYIIYMPGQCNSGPGDLPPPIGSGFLNNTLESQLPRMILSE